MDNVCENVNAAGIAYSVGAVDGVYGLNAQVNVLPLPTVNTVVKYADIDVP